MNHGTRRAVVFDMDGVLTDSEPLINAAAVQMFRERGIAVQPDDFHPFVGTGENRYLGGVAEKYGVPLDIADAKRRTYEIYLQLVPTQLRAFPGAVSLVRACREAGLRVAVASSADRIKIDANLRQIGLPPETWDAIVTGDDVEHKKPAPDIFLAAARRLGLSPQACVVIEDAVNGVQAARAAGMYCVAVAQSFPDHLLREADLVRSSIADVVVADLTGEGQGEPASPVALSPLPVVSPPSSKTVGPWGFGMTLLLSVGIAAGFVAAQALAAVALIGFGRMIGDAELGSLAQLEQSGLYWAVATLAGVPVTLALVTLCAWLRRGFPVATYLGLRRVSPATVGRWFLWLLLFMVASDLTTWLLGRPLVPDVMVEAYRSSRFPPLLWLALVVGAPLSEEFFFRGFLLGGLMRSWLRPGGAIVVSALLWAVIHLQYDLYGMAIILAAGLLFGCARWMTGSLYIPLLLHALMNTVATLQVVWLLYRS